MMLPFLPSSLRPLDSGVDLPDCIRQSKPDRGRKNLTACRAGGFTLFELLAVLTVISIMLALVVGSYGSWGTAHALTGATRIIDAGLNQARAIAITRRAYVAFSYGSATTTNHNQVVTGFQFFLCAPTNDTTSVEEVLKTVLSPDRELAEITDKLDLSPAGPMQRLSGHVRLAYVRESDLASAPPVTYSDMTLFFRPDGSVLSDPEDVHAHHIIIYTQERFHRGGMLSDHLYRILRLDLATGLVTILNPGVTP